QRDSSLRITFVGSSRKLEKSLMDRYQAHFVPLKIEGLKGMGWKTFKSLFILPFSFLKSLGLLLRLKPDLVIGVGGYSSGPIVLLASWLKIPTLIMEQNLRPGFTNRLLLPWIKKAVVAFESSLPYFKGKGQFIGNPTREEFLTITPKPRNSKFTLLIFGGSQGSHFLNKGITDALPFIKEQKNSLRIIHQTGQVDLAWVKDGYLTNGFSDFTVLSFFHDMAEQFKISDLIVCRAGATTIAELIAAQKAAILIPFAQATDNHQVANAKELERVQGACVITEDEFQPMAFADKIREFMIHKDKLDMMEKNLRQLKTANVAAKISDLCFELMEKT
ncbi:MAG: UDP-N-acetylglucosamine--N-acetylmuramyl-(pentapeptide) pyrophosphoryl-undecaprenol N-acetylglucosamine transferase, partial [Candidatus Aminicenantes bacterium]|nr:UDP-N-acetylglucosamine--N-acetylmuramyl-(pentapeptide) pyrophosphoryl-undecaprenol N-acetylglucosamine transferase [Candidatus Aminicenantes bacterium]